MGNGHWIYTMTIVTRPVAVIDGSVALRTRMRGTFRGRNLLGVNDEVQCLQALHENRAVYEGACEESKSALTNLSRLELQQREDYAEGARKHDVAVVDRANGRVWLKDALAELREELARVHRVGNRVDINLLPRRRDEPLVRRKRVVA